MKTLAKLTTAFLFTTSLGIMANTTAQQTQSQGNQSTAQSTTPTTHSTTPTKQTVTPATQATTPTTQTATPATEATTPKGIDITIKSSTHPKGEPKGLYIVDFKATRVDTNQSSDHTYRVYCPTSTVRNITANQKTGDLMTATEEDAMAFSNGTVLQKVVESVCKNEG